MVTFSRDASGMYFATAASEARVGFLFAEAGRSDPSFDLTAVSWLALNNAGYFAFFEPSATRDWPSFVGKIREAFGASFQSQLGWFDDSGAVQPSLIATDWSSSPPAVAQSFSLVFRQSVTFSVQPSLLGGEPTIVFDDASGAFRLNNGSGTNDVFLLTATRPAASSVTFSSTAPFAALPVTGELAATLSIAFQLSSNDLKQFEAGMMYFNPPQSGGLVGALNYPLFRSAGAPGAPFGFNVSLDMLAPLDPLRSFFQFTDPVVGTNYATASGKPLYFQTNADSVEAASRFVFASRPVQDASDARYYYLTPAGQFGVSLSMQTNAAAQSAEAAPARMLCGISGTEFLDVATGAAPDRIEFVPAQPAYRIPGGADLAGVPVYFSNVATTSYARVLTREGSYVSQPQSAPLYAQAGAAPAMFGGRAPGSGLDVYVLDYLPIDSWTAAQAAPPTPLVPYGGLDFATDPNLKLDAFVEMESAALNPTRTEAYLAAKPNSAGASVRRAVPRALAATGDTKAMTPQGMLAGIGGTPPTWNSLEMAISAAGLLAFGQMGPEIRKAVQQNQIFTVISTNPGALFDFSASALTIGDWTFDLSPGGLAAPDGTPPIFLMKFFPGASIADLVDDTRRWSQPDVFNTAPFTAVDAQAYLQQLIAEAKEAVFPNGGTQPDTDSLYWNFYQTVTDPAFSGVLAVNCNMRLDTLPTAIRAVLGGMQDPGIPGFRAHHVGVAINNTDPSQPTPTLAQSATFALVDYEKSPDSGPPPGLSIDYGFDVAFLRALFTSSELRNFSCEIDLTINKLFDTGVNQDNGARSFLAAGDDQGNTIKITGAYQANSTSGDHSSSGEGIYSFLAQEQFVYDFTDSSGQPNNKYLKKITLTKLQFSFDNESPAETQPANGTTTRIDAHFGIWGHIEFNELKVLDIFSFEKLEFSDLGISVSFDLTVFDPDIRKQPETAKLTLGFSPGNLRLDLGATEKRTGASSMLDLIPFKLKSFLYATGDGQSIESLDYYSLSHVAGLTENGIKLQDKFNYALIFDLDLGSMGGLVGSLSAFQFSMVIGWQNAGQGGGIAFGVQLPQVDGKLEIKIQGVLTISIAQFTLLYATDSEPPMLVLGLQDCFIDVLGTRVPPKGTISIGLFAPTEGADQIGWIGAYNLGEDGGGGGGDGDDGGALIDHPRPVLALADGEFAEQFPSSGGAPVPGEVGQRLPSGPVPALFADTAGGDDGGVFALNYVGLGQRVGPDPASPPTNFGEFLSYMQNDFWEKLKNKEFADIYHPNGRWIFVSDFTLLKLIEIGTVFYDVTPFYALQISLLGGAGKGFSFEITYTKVTDEIGLYAITIALPDTLRNFQVGVASVTLPTLSVNIYTNGDWKADLGFPSGDDWSVCFRVQAQAGPVPVTGSGGFYLAALSSATDPDVFKGTYQSIVAFGFALRLGVGKDFVAGPLKAGVSVTFFGIIQGAAGYLTSGGGDIFRTPDALQLQGQIGIIGELYGSVDFVIIKASVNVRLQASIGLVLTYEPKVAGGGDGSILLYIEASVSVSVSVRINLFFFKVTISFSFRASFRFEWQLVGSNSAKAALLASHRAVRALVAPTALPLLPGLAATLPLLYLPEVTVVFPNATDAGAPWLAVSLGIQYDPAPPQNPPYAAFKPFEAVTTQLATFAVMHALNLPSYDSIVQLNDDPHAGTIGLLSLDSDPELLTDWLTYENVLGQLGNFQAEVAAPRAETQATAFPMPPFLQLATTGRMNGTSPDEFSCVFQTKNPVAESYLETVDAYFNQLFVNRTPAAPSDAQAEASGSGTDPLTPLSEVIFFDYFKGLIRGAVHQLLVTMQNQGLGQAKLDTLFSAAAGAPTPDAQSLFQQLAGQMSSSMRSGIRLPYADGLTVPAGPVDPDTNAMFALLWQEFPVGGFGDSGCYTIALTKPETNADPLQDWIALDASYVLSKSSIDGYSGLTAGALTQPGSPAPIAFTDTGPQSFAFQSPIVWTSAEGRTRTLQPFPPSLSRLQRAEGSAAIDVLVKSRTADGPYQPDGTPLPSGDVQFATSVGLTVRQIPDGSQGGVLKDVFALSGASQADESLLGSILDDLRGGNRPIAAIEILYQTAAGEPGLVSAVIDPSQVFALRTNTTSVSQPPPSLTARAEATVPPVPPGVSVGATVDLGQDGGYSFLQIIQQATVTNAAGYYLRYTDTKGHSLPAALFQKGVGAITLLIRYVASAQDNSIAAPLVVQPYHNAVLLANTQASLVYFAETTDPALAIRYATNAAGTFGVTLSRSGSVTDLTPSARLAATAVLTANGGIDHDAAITALRAHGILADADLQAELFAMGAAPAALNALYSLVTYSVEKSTGFIASNLSAPIQPQRPEDEDPNSDYRIVVPLYNLAEANVGQADPDRYASINQRFTIDFYTTDAFGNQLPSPNRYSDTNLYFDPIVPVDQWNGVITTYDFAGPAGPRANTVWLKLEPTESAFDGMSDDERAATLAHLRTIRDQITGPGVSFYVETSLARDADGSLTPFLLGATDTAKIIAMVEALIGWLADRQTNAFPLPVEIALAVTGPGALPPLFPLAVMLGILRDPALISPYIKDGDTILLPSAQNVASTAAPATGDTGNLSAFAADFVAAFPAQKLAVGLTGTDAVQPPELLSSTLKARKKLKAAKLATDGSRGATSTNAQSLWAAQASLLDISIGTGTGAGPRFLSPKPLDNALNTATVPLPDLDPPLPSLPAQRLFVDVDLDTYNRTFFQTIDTLLGPASAAQAFETANAAFVEIARGREAIAQKYATHEVDWLFPSGSPFTGTDDQRTVARAVFEQQMRASLSTAYAVDTIIQYDVAWKGPVSGAADQTIELFGQIQAILAGTYQWSGATLTATTPAAHSLSDGDRVLMLFTADAGSAAPGDGVYAVTVTGETTFTIVVSNGSGTGSFSGTLQNSGLSTAHVEVVSNGTSPLTFLYGTPDIADRAIETMDLRYNVTNLQCFLAPPSAEGEARPSLWLQLIDPYPGSVPPHIGPQGTPTDIPVVFRQYPTPPTLVRQRWAVPDDDGKPAAANPIADHSRWNYFYTYQAFLAAQDRINTSITYNTDLRATSSGVALRAAADGETSYTLFQALARAIAVIDRLRPTLQKLADPLWPAAIQAVANAVGEVTANSTWSDGVRTFAISTQVTDTYLIADKVVAPSTQVIDLAWPKAQGESSYSGVTLALTALDPASATLQPYPNQTTEPLAGGIEVRVPNAPLVPLGALHEISVAGLNVLAAENALGAVQVERNLITLSAPDNSRWEVTGAFIYTTAQVRSSQPVTPLIDVSAPIDVTTLPRLGTGTSCASPSPSSLCQRIYTILANLLADPAQSRSLAAAHAANDVGADAVRRMKMGCAFRFPLPSVSGTGFNQASINPLVPVVLARSFDINGQDPAQLGDFAALFAQAIDSWSTQNAIVYGIGAQPAGAQFVFDATLYAALSGTDTPVLNFSTLYLELTDIDPA